MRDPKGTVFDVESNANAIRTSSLLEADHAKWCDHGAYISTFGPQSQHSVVSIAHTLSLPGSVSMSPPYSLPIPRIQPPPPHRCPSTPSTNSTCLSLCLSLSLSLSLSAAAARRFPGAPRHCPWSSHLSSVSVSLSLCMSVCLSLSAAAARRYPGAPRHRQ